MSRFEVALLMSAVFLATAPGSAADRPVARWKLAGDAKNAIPAGADGQNQGVTFEEGTFPHKSAKFDGRGSHIAIPHAESLHLGTGDFTISLWVNTAAESDDDLGDLISQFDAKSR